MGFWDFAKKATDALREKGEEIQEWIYKLEDESDDALLDLLYRKRNSPLDSQCMAAKQILKNRGYSEPLKEAIRRKM